jgi:hypothetical protein
MPRRSRIALEKQVGEQADKINSQAETISSQAEKISSQAEQISSLQAIIAMNVSLANFQARREQLALEEKYIPLKRAARGRYSYEAARKWCERTARAVAEGRTDLGLVKAHKEGARWWVLQSSIDDYINRLGG